MNLNNTLYGRIVGQIKRSNNQEAVMEYLRSFGFYFVESEVLLKLHPKLGIPPKHMKYSFMIRGIKKNIDDTRIIVGIKLWGDKVDRVLLYIQGDLDSRLKIPWKERQDINFKKIKIRVKFPDYLNYEERKKWRWEHAKVKKDPNYKPTAMYQKAKPDVVFI